MKFRIICQFVLGAVISTTPTHAQQSVSRDWAVLPDFDALRYEIGWADNYDEICSMVRRPIREMHAHMEADEWDAAAELSGRWLQSCPVDMRIHMYRSIAFKKLSNMQQSELHAKWFSGLVDSVMASGDGRSPESAFVTISVEEEYDVLTALQLKAKSQDLVDGRDRFVVTDHQGNEHEIYFFPEAHWKRLSNMFPADPVQQQ